MPGANRSAPRSSPLNPSKREEAGANARKLRRAHGRQLSDRRPLDRRANHVGFELHELVVARRSAVDQQSLDRRAAGAKSVDDVGDLVGDRVRPQRGRTARA